MQVQLSHVPVLGSDWRWTGVAGGDEESDAGYDLEHFPAVTKPSCEVVLLWRIPRKYWVVLTRVMLLKGWSFVNGSEEIW